jgi:acetyl esterase/lipase
MTRNPLGSVLASSLATSLPSVLAFVLLAAPLSFAQLSPAATWATQAANGYRVAPNVTYGTASGVDLKLDAYIRRDVQTPQPTLIYMHGGFWVAGNKEAAAPILLPWMEMGWNVINVEYRLGAAALAPAALEDCLCALRFVAGQAMNYNVDLNKIVVMGESAGGHLALALGVTPSSAGLDLGCTGPALPRVAAVLNWFGITDVPDIIDGANFRAPAARWFGSLPNRMEIAKRVSPMTYVRDGLPPILTVHGDADPVVPYQQAVRLHQALAKTNTPNQLLTVPGGGHGGFNNAQRLMIYTTIREFLKKNGVMP